MKSLIVLWKQLADEAASWCHTSATLDYNKLERRFEHEGMAFIAITLPNFGKDFERSLEVGKIERNRFQGFAFSGGLPRFLSGFLARVFDRGTGVLLDDPCVDSILAVRQLTLMFAKILVPLSDEKVSGAMQGFVDVEAEVKANDEVLSQDLLREFERMSLLLWADVCTEVDREVYEGSLVPRHGPGSTADRLLGNKKYDQIEWTQRLEGLFPFMDNVLPSPRYFRELERVHFREPDTERPVRVISVPKTQKTPRIIAIEPTCMQFMQQAISKSLVKKLESRSVGDNHRRNLCFGFVGFESQDPNREMAALGSYKQTLATLDMSEASDRVSNQHVLSLFRWWPWLSEAVQVTRSTKADVLGHGVMPLSKFASMGSALCFPVEAMVFTTIIFLALERSANTRFTRKDVLSFAGQVRVYGDDIIVPVDVVEPVVDLLEAFGLKVNKSKSFWNGKFRESCGGDYYDGTWVTPVRVRRHVPAQLGSGRLPNSITGKRAEEVISLVSFRNQLYFAGYWQTCKWLDQNLRKLLHGCYPVVESTSPVLGRHSVLPYQAERVGKHTFAPLVRGYKVYSRLPKSELDNSRALVKWFLKEGDEPFFDKDHLHRAGRPRSVGIKIAWSSPF